jgi:hypothetical protein
MLCWLLRLDAGRDDNFAIISFQTSSVGSADTAGLK